MVMLTKHETFNSSFTQPNFRMIRFLMVFNTMLCYFFKYYKIIGLMGPQTSVHSSYMPADMVTIRYQRRS